MKLTIANAALLMSMTAFASAASVNVNGYINVNFTTNPAVASTVGSTYTARIGSYTGGTGSLPLSTTFSQINSSWTQVGSYQFATSQAGNLAGGFKGNNLNFTNALGLAGTNVWVWVTDGGNSNLLMRATTSAAGDFLFKNDSDIPNLGNLGISTAARPGWALSLGTFTTTGVNAAYGGSYVVNVVPEPSAALLGAFGAIGLLRRRRN